MQRTLFVHIGTHKTGTTSIQNFLRSHEMKLKQCGIFLPSSGTVNAKSGHHNIAWEIRKDDRYRRGFGGVDRLVSELGACREGVAVISSEDFEYLVQYPGQLKAFDERIEAAGFSARYIVYFRDPNSYARSLYCELEITGLVDDDFEKFRGSIENRGYVRANGDCYYEFRYGSFVKNWEAIVGPKLHASSFDDAVHGVGLLPSFLATIGASKDLIDESRMAPYANTMFDKFQELAHELTVIRNSRSWRMTAPLRRILACWRRVWHRQPGALSKPPVAAESNSGYAAGSHCNFSYSQDLAEARRDQPDLSALRGTVLSSAVAIADIRGFMK